MSASLLRYWLPVLVWMALIVSLSSRPDFRAAAPAPVAESPEVFFAVSKLAHVVEYGVLGLLLLRALRSRGGRVRLPLLAAVVVAVLISGLFGALDELRQSFVPNRSPRIADIALDTASALAASLLAAGWLRLRPSPPGPLDTPSPPNLLSLKGRGGASGNWPLVSPSPAHSERGPGGEGR